MTWQLKAMCNSGLNPGLEKDIRETTDDTLIKSVDE